MLKFVANGVCSSLSNAGSLSVGVTGIALTKLDGTAKGGVVFAIGEQIKRPIRFIGIGEGVGDLRPFNAGEFVDALFSPVK